MGDSLRALYVCYLSLEDPLVHTQVVAYLEGLARRGHTIHLLTYEPALTPERRRSLEADLRRRGIEWHSLRYHKRPSLPATVYDVLVGAVRAVWLVRRHRLDAVHARNHVPAAMALIARRLTGCKLIFDIRGLMADEYVDAGHWKRGGTAFRLTEWVQRLAMRRANGIVVLTEAVRDYLSPNGSGGLRPLVIPCCVDLARMNGHAAGQLAVRQELGLGDRPVMIYIGKLTGWYMESEMVEFFAKARRLLPGLAFLVLTQADPRPIEVEFERRGIPAADYLITRAEAAEVGRYLAAADFGISFVRPSFSKISSSPTKIAEYLGAGLPVVTTAVGDTAALFADGGLGVVIHDFSPGAYDAAAQEVERLARDAAARDRCRSAARERLSLEKVGIPRYDSLYRQVAGA